MAEGFKSDKGPAGLASPRWSCSYEDALGRTICETRPGFRGALLITSNEYNTANQLVATRAYVPVTKKLHAYPGFLNSP